MLNHTRYAVRSQFEQHGAQSRLALATNQLRPAVYFRGRLAEPLIAREGLAALWSVVVSDLKWRPRPRLAFQAWLEQQDRAFAAQFAQRRLAQLDEIRAALDRLVALDALRQQRRAGFEAARQRYLAWAARDEIEAMRLLDPVITLHPDELSFEAFSRDQSSYARLSLPLGLFAAEAGSAWGTTNIDFSAALHDHLDRLRRYRSTVFELGAAGFGSSSTIVAPGTAAATVYEKKIPLPDGWLEGFLNVHGLMAMQLTRVRLAPIDVLNVLRVLDARKARTSPRALRFELRPGKPASLFIEPFDIRIQASPVSVHPGTEWHSVRVWGRDRLKCLRRVLPVTREVEVHLAGHGMPSLWVCTLLDGSVFTLALSGWTDNDWVAGEGQFALLTRRAAIDSQALERVHAVLAQHRVLDFATLASQAQVSLEQARSGVSLLCQDGRAMFDLAAGRPRHRDLGATPFSAGRALKLAASTVAADPLALAAQAIVGAGAIRIIARRPVPDGYKLSGNSADEGGGARLRPQVHVSADGRILAADCTCAHMQRHGLAKGPCAHVLALRLLHLELAP